MGDNSSYSVKEFLSHALEDIDKKISEVHSDIKDIKIQTTKTNGRVSRLENHRSYLWGAFAALIFVSGALMFLTKFWLENSAKKWATEAINDVLAEYEINE